jgi:hypothetical protein
MQERLERILEQQERDARDPQRLDLLYRGSLPSKALYGEGRSVQLSPQRGGNGLKVDGDLLRQIAARFGGLQEVGDYAPSDRPYVDRLAAAREHLLALGRDSVPAALAPGEVVLNAQQQRAVMPRPGMQKALLPEQIAAFYAARRRRI